MDETEETVADKYPFLSEEWVAEVRRLGDEARAEGGGAKIPHQVKMNQVITDVPFGDGTINAHMDTSTGEMQMEMGHMENPDLTGMAGSPGRGACRCPRRERTPRTTRLLPARERGR